MTFQEQLNLMRAGGVPLPLMPGQATAQAVRLRAEGMPYTSIAIVMGTYHGTRLTSQGWYRRCRENGSPPKLNQLPPQRRAS